jgi:hypothetical protein
MRCNTLLHTPKFPQFSNNDNDPDNDGKPHFKTCWTTRTYTLCPSLTSCCIQSYNMFHGKDNLKKIYIQGTRVSEENFINYVMRGYTWHGHLLREKQDTCNCKHDSNSCNGCMWTTSLCHMTYSIIWQRRKLTAVGQSDLTERNATEPHLLCASCWFLI